MITTMDKYFSRKLELLSLYIYLDIFMYISSFLSRHLKHVSGQIHPQLQTAVPTASNYC